MAGIARKTKIHRVRSKAIAKVATACIALSSAAFSAEQVSGEIPSIFTLADVFKLEYASDPQIAPDGMNTVYVRNSMDVMTDRRRSALWFVNRAGSAHYKIVTKDADPTFPRWSPLGDRLAYISKSASTSQISVYNTRTGQTDVIGTFPVPPSTLAWSPDGKYIAFVVFVADGPGQTTVQMPKKPQGATWAEPVEVIDSLVFRLDGEGWIRPGFKHLFVLPVESSQPVARQLTAGAFNHGGVPAWSLDSSKLYISANRHDDWEYDALNTEIYEIDVGNRAIRALTERIGPDSSPVVSPDGARIAFIGFDDKHQSYQETDLYVMNQDGSNKRLLTGDFDRGINNPTWHHDSNGLYFLYSDKGVTKIGYATLSGAVTELVQNVGGTVLDRPYASGSYSVSEQGEIAFTITAAHRPADIAVAGVDSVARRLTHLNEDLFQHRDVGQIEEIWFNSSLDHRAIQGWLAKPPGFNPASKYPVILEIHGGPDANYGDRFSAQVELFTAAGYLVLYANPRGSTSYGAEFAGLAYQNYPGDEYFDLMSAVDTLITRDYVDKQNLFVTGGSAGGVLSSWIIGKTQRFGAAAIVNPAVNWISYALTTDRYDVFSRYFFPGFPWDHQDHYWKRSPLSLVGKVETPTMLITGEADYRTPISETEQFYQALKLRRIQTVMVRIPGASHNIAARPSHMVAKVAHILAWFERHRTRPIVDKT